MGDRALSLRNVSFSFGSQPVIRSVSLDVRPGELLVLVGPSGCGKTTLLSLMSGHLQASAGAIERSVTLRTVFQSDGLFPWLTVEQNVSEAVGVHEDAKVRAEQTLRWLKIVNMEEHRHRFPHELSGGMRQRAQLARAMVGNVGLLLLDEPFSALDYQARQQMRQVLLNAFKQAKPSPGIVFVTHDLEEAVSLADRILVLSPRPASVEAEHELRGIAPRSVTDDAARQMLSKLMSHFGLDNPSFSIGAS